LLVFCALVVQRHMFVVRSTDELNRDLERRVAEKTRAIEAHHEQLRRIEREQVIVRERGRILADMHDGLGASLVALRRLIQSGRADQRELEARVDEALQEMRIAIDALEPVDGDIAAVLGNLRQRLQPTLERAGLQVVWQVGDLVPIENLTPAAIFAVQRALLEAFTNILKHADARTVTLSVQTDPAQQGAEITLSDDGKGFAPGARGRGLSNIEQRIRAIGATAQIESVVGAGTRVTMHLPWRLPVEPAPSLLVPG
jgi:signal transduction histidine kinase